MKKEITKYNQLLRSFTQLKRLSYKTLYGGALSKKALREESKSLKSLIKNNSLYLNIDFNHNELKSLVIAEKKKDVFDGLILKVHHLFIDNITQSKLNLVIQEIYQFFGPETQDIRISVSSEPSKLLRTLLKYGFKIEGQRIYADIRESLLKIEQKELELAEGFILRKPKLKEIDALVELEKQVHLNEPTSVLDYNQVNLKEIRKFLIKLRAENTFVAVYHRDKPIAHIGYHFKEGRGCIGTIAVAVGFQRQGLSYILYEYALRDMLKKKVKVYTGYTSTFKTLKQGKKLGRKPYEYILSYQP